MEKKGKRDCVYVVLALEDTPVMYTVTGQEDTVIILNILTGISIRSPVLQLTPLEQRQLNAPLALEPMAYVRVCVSNAECVRGHCMCVCGVCVFVYLSLSVCKVTACLCIGL